MSGTEMEKKVEEEEKKGGELLFCGSTCWDVIGRRKGTVEGNLVSPTRLRPLVGVDIRFVASGCLSCHCVALDVEGRCYTWGRNEKGQLGHGDTIQRDRPTVVSELSKYKIIKAGSGRNHTVVVTEDGNSLAFGWNKHGQLGSGSTRNGLVSPSPSSSHRNSIADDSVTLQLGTRDPTRNPLRPVPLQLLEPHQNGNTIERERCDDNDDESREIEEFRILGHPMCLKRRRDSSYLSSPSPTKRMTVETDLEKRKAALKSWGSQPIHVADPDVFDMMEQEKKRQFMGIELIASENFVCRAVMEALGSHLTNKYSEGMPGARYYGGNQYIDEIETLCWKRALEAFGLDAENWGVNVQPYSCTSANFAVFTGLLLPGDRIMGLDTPSGGNTSHGYYTPNGRKVSGASIFFESLPYKVNPQTGYIDYEKLEERALDFRPKILICGGSSFPREWDYARFRQIADKCGAILLCDMAQISGLIAAKEAANPFEYCDIVTSTTHKSLRGPRGGIIFYRKGKKPKKGGLLLSQGDCNEQYDFEEKINFAVFPSLQGGPHNNHIAALAIALKQVATPEYKAYMQQVKKNAQALASSLLRRKCKLITGGTDNHLLLWDLRPFGLTGKIYEKVCEMCHITVNKIAIFGENGIITPGGVRIGTPAMTSRGCLESDFDTIASFLLRAAHIASMMQRDHGKLPKASVKSLQEHKDILELRMQVETFASQFAMPGFDI